MVSNNQFVRLNDFTGGLVTNIPSSQLELNQSPALDNILLKKRGFESRYGDSAFNSSAMNSGANVQGLAYYKEQGGNEFLVAVAGAKVYKSDDLDGTMDEISAAGGSSAPTAGQNNIWSPMVLKNLLLLVGGPLNTPDVPKSWDGSTASNNYQNLAGTPPQGYLGFVTHDRAFIGKTAAAKSTLYWSVLSNPEDWAGTGSGNTTVDTNDGDYLTAGVPLNNDVTMIFKQYSIHHLLTNRAPFPTKPFNRGIGCCGKHAAINAEGLIYFVTKQPRLKITDGYRIISLPDTLDDVWDGINKNMLDYIELVYDPSKRLLHCIVANTTSTSKNLDIIWDIEHNCWLRNTTGYDINVGCIARGQRFYGGHTDGVIYLKNDTSTQNDASETSGAVNSYYTTSHINLDNTFISKQFPYADMDITIKTTGVLKYSYGYDYSLNKSGSVSLRDPGGQWNVDTWNGTFVWGGQAALLRRIYPRGRGNNFQMKLFNDLSGQGFEVRELALAYKAGAVKEQTVI